jgi:hypothetical protein
VKRFVPGGAVIVLTLLAGCGGDRIYTLAKTRACLQGKHVRMHPPRTDFVASSATGGTVVAKIGRNSVTLSFGVTTADADGLNAEYHRVRGRNIGIDDILKQQGNAVMLWHMHPEDPQIAFLMHCLK